MQSGEIRQRFFDFFKEKGHKYVPSAPIVNNSDPSLMFTNAGMNQFKDYFLGTKEIVDSRVVDTQKCLRVSGKHNDLEEVGIDSYHHTMFEMLGNWSFGDYFKKEVIDWSWELLTEVYGLASDRLYATIFEGDTKDGLERDEEAYDLWRNYLPEDRILDGSKEDNFWEMGETGPCGPCSEIHIDLRTDEERRKTDGASLVNKDHPMVIEIWNLVFIQFNRMASGDLQTLPEKHIDTGMGFERLCMAIQGKKSNYESDIFTPFIEEIQSITGVKYHNKYGPNEKVDTAFRVVADHLRAVAFTIADGQIPGNSGAGYVIRRILRRAVRYYYTFLDWKQPLLTKLIGLLADRFEVVFPELKAQEDFVARVVKEEEKSFLRTLEDGIQRFNMLEVKGEIVSGQDAFLLYDTYGFPIDLTALMAKEQGLDVDFAGFEKSLKEQKDRSRKDAVQKVGDWNIYKEDKSTEFIGYDHTEAYPVYITRTREVTKKNKKVNQIVLNQTPFYAEGGGQIGDTGILVSQSGQRIKVLDTVRENELIVHIVDQLPEDPVEPFHAEINVARRRATENNHSATHLLHAALRNVLGDHVQQKGSLVSDKYLRFDFSHYEKVTREQLDTIEKIVNAKIGEDIILDERREVPIEQAKEEGATMLFGEKYGEKVRMIIFDEKYSKELCGGCHVSTTSKIRLFRITSESSVASGIRRIEAVTGYSALDYLDREVEELSSIRSLFKNPVNVAGQVENLLQENKELIKELEIVKLAKSQDLKKTLLQKVVDKKGYSVLSAYTDGLDSKNLKNIVFEIADQYSPAIVVIGDQSGESANIMIHIDKSLVERYDLNAGKLIREVSSLIKGGGGGQPFFASAGGKNPDGIPGAIAKLSDLIEAQIEA